VIPGPVTGTSPPAASDPLDPRTPVLRVVAPSVDPGPPAPETPPAPLNPPAADAEPADPAAEDPEPFAVPLSEGSAMSPPPAPNRPARWNAVEPHAAPTSPSPTRATTVTARTPGLVLIDSHGPMTTTSRSSWRATKDGALPLAVRTIRQTRLNAQVP
jgi:hypothetical protein